MKCVGPQSVDWMSDTVARKHCDELSSFGLQDRSEAANGRRAWKTGTSRWPHPPTPGTGLPIIECSVDGIILAPAVGTGVFIVTKK
jgi:hypothetical protein